jgi:hypothetical protein
MLLPAERQRYARHLLLSEVGEAGQERLMRAAVQLPVDAAPRPAAVARDYLERAGMRPGNSDRSERPVRSPCDPQLNREAVRALAGDATLEPAAAALLGALYAVEAIKAELGLGAPLQLPAGLRLSAEGA